MYLYGIIKVPYCMLYLIVAVAVAVTVTVVNYVALVTSLLEK